MNLDTITITVCTGTKCFFKGSEGVLEAFRTELGTDSLGLALDGRVQVKASRCFGACALGPVVIINGDIYEQVKVEQVSSILERYL